MIRPHGRFVWLTLIVATSLARGGPQAHAQVARRPVTPGGVAGARASTSPTVDGSLNDSAWAAAPIVAGFLQHEPFEGTTPSERTEVRVLYDRDALYVGAWMYDSDPSGILFGENRRDTDLAEADALLIVLDTFLDRQNAFVFGTTPAGVEYDGQVTRNGEGGLNTFQRQQGGAGAAGGFNVNWDGSWEVATSRDEVGWYAEFRIPFSTLRYPSGGEQQWGFNVARTLRRRNEEMFLFPVPRQFSVYRVSDAGTLGGIEAPARRTVQVTPFALSTVQREYAVAEKADVDGELGLDAKIGVTPSLNLDLTYNTDFAQVEADDEQVNLTRFSLFLPEKRPFFLENAGIFTVGAPQAGSEQGLDLFYSRRVGIGPNGEPVPIVGGARLTGKVGGVTVGFLDIQTEDVPVSGLHANNYGVARLLKELPNRSRVGGLFVSRFDPSDTDDYNLTYSIDGRVGIGEHANIDAFAARTETPGVSGRQRAIGLIGSYESRDWSLGTEFRDIGEDFNPEVGFLPRRGYRFYVGRLQRNLRVPRWTWLREMTPHLLVREYRDFEGFTLTRYVHVDHAMEFANGGSLSMAVNVRKEGLTEPFEIERDVVLSPGTYDFTEGRVRFNSNASARWSLSADVTAGQFFEGNRSSATGSVTNRMGSTWISTVQVRYDRVDIPEGEFDTFLTSLRAAYSFTPRIFLQGLVQYNSQRDTFSSNIRFGWLGTAGTGLFLVYNDIERTEPRFAPSNRTFIVKFTKQFNLIG